MKTFIIVLFILCASVRVGTSQTNHTNPQPVPTFALWEAQLPEAQGAFAVSLNSICSVALERYNLKYENKTYPVTECSVETVGGKTARFYFVRENDDQNSTTGGTTPLKEAMQGVAASIQGQESEKDKKLRVVKIYPESSTVSTVEYRLADEKKVVDLYKSLHDAWIASAP